MAGSVEMSAALTNVSPEGIVFLLVLLFLYIFIDDYMDTHDNALTRVIEWVQEHPVRSCVIGLPLLVALVTAFITVRTGGV